MENRRGENIFELPMKKVCYTYFERIDRIEQCKHRKCSQLDLIEICRQSWGRNGWELVVLSEDDARPHSYYPEFKAEISQIPSVNPIPYDYHCFMRWLAMAHNGGGLMIDYDVVNHDFESAELLNRDKLTIYQGIVPSVVFGSGEQYLQACRKFVGSRMIGTRYFEHLV